MAVASLIGEKLFNFAELIEKDFFKSLMNSQFEWIYHLSLCFNSSKVDQFLKMMDQYSNQIKGDVRYIFILIHNNYLLLFYRKL